MRRLPAVVKRQFKILVVVYFATGWLWGPPVEAAFHLQRADGSSPPAKGLHVEGMATWRLPGTVARPPAPQRVQEARTRPVVAPTRSNDSTNAYVDPWGCEARHSQQWSPSGEYWGKYQFDRSTWAAHGGSPGSYGSASEAEQDAVASRVKYDAWPNC